MLRGLERRKPEYIESLDMPYDPNKFNFTKVKDEEKICLFQAKRETNDSPEAGTEVSFLRNSRARLSEL